MKILEYTAIGVIIPLHKQLFNFEKICIGFSKQSYLDFTLYIVLDRPCNDELKHCILNDSINSVIDYIKHICEKYNLKHVVVESHTIPDHLIMNDNVFLAGMIRNIGIERAREDGCNIFINVDGDCVPDSKLVQCHMEKCRYESSILSIGRRRESEYRWMDIRETVNPICNVGLFKNNGIVLLNSDLLKECMIVWSCNIGFNIYTLEIIKKFNKIYYDRYEFFNSMFLGRWGYVFWKCKWCT